MAFNCDKYLRTDKLPTQWCWGRGDGVVLKCIIRAIEKLSWNVDGVCFASGMGYNGGINSYVNCNTVHITRGRAIAYATGIRLTNPSKHVIVVSGDGDTLTAGGNHTIHRCRKNIDLAHIVISSFIYGLTNPQTSLATPKGFYTVAAQFGNTDPSSDVCGLAKAVGASFVARRDVIEANKLENLVYKALAHKGYGFVDVFSNCHINLGRKSKMGEAVAMLDWVKNRVADESKSESIDFEERKDKFPTGVLYEDSAQPEYCYAYEEARHTVKEKRTVDLGALR